MGEDTDYHLVKQLVSEAIGAPRAEREALLMRLAPDDPEARARAAELLAQEDSAAGFLEEPILLPRASFAGYRLLRLIGQGGSSLVFEAEQASPKRKVALKVLVNADRHHDADSGDRWRRFHAEGELLARLDHPCIARVIETGTVREPNSIQESGGETAYLAVEWIEDARTLTDYAEVEGLDLRARVVLVVQVARAVAHAQERGVVHRDLKPGNLLVDGSGRPRVIDFGVAHLLEQATDANPRTSAGGFLGTLAYASPEQCRGEPEAIGPATDVHALGVVLFELACGGPPFELKGLSIPQALTVIQEHAPRKTSSWGVTLNKDLEAVLRKSLAKDPGDRYPSASALADDLQRYLDGVPVEARAPNLLADAKLFLRRHKRASLAVLAGSLLIVLAGASLLLFHVRQRELEERGRIQAQAATDFVTSLLELANPREHEPSELNVRSLLDAASDRLASTTWVDRGAVAELHGTLANAYREIGDFAPALEHAEEALALYRGLDGIGPAQLVGILNMVTHAYVDAGGHERALELIEEAAELAQRHPEVPGIFHAITCSHLARVRLAQGELEESEERANFALERYQEELGERHRAVPRALNTLVGVHLARGDGAAARPLAERALEVDLENYGRESLLTARSRLGLARVLNALGDTERALTEAHEAADVLRRLLPPEHPDRVAAGKLAGRTD